MKAIKPLDKIASDYTSLLENEFHLRVSLMNKRLSNI